MSSSSRVMSSNGACSHDNEGIVTSSMQDSSHRSSAATSTGGTSNSPVGVSNSANYLVSEHEDEGEEGEEDNTRRICNSVNVSKNSASPLSVSKVDTDSKLAAPAEIPPEPIEQEEVRDAGDESDEYSYTYEDDDYHISGFLIPDPHPVEEQLMAQIPEELPSKSNISNANSKSSSSKSSQISKKESSPMPLSSSSSTKTDKNLKSNYQTINSSSASTNLDSDNLTRKSTWKEPSKAAVSMSLRAEKEKTGGKRRLASDLYKIMMNDTEDAGFSLEPSNEDNMEKWKIKLFKFDSDSNLHKDLMALGLTCVELEMSFPDQYPFEPPFVRVVRPRFKRQTGFVMNGAICSELLTSEGWNPVNDIESVIVSIRSLLVVGNGRLAAAVNLPERKQDVLLQKKLKNEAGGDDIDDDEDEDEEDETNQNNKRKGNSSDNRKKRSKTFVGQYSAAEARAAYSHISDYHKKNGWDSTGWWARKG